MFLESGARKKKFLTDPVDIIPFPAQNLREKLPAKEIVNAPNVKPTEQTAPVQKILQTPTGNSQVKTISIYQHTRVSEQQNTNDENLPREKYTIENVKVLWRKYSAILKNKGEFTFSSVLANSEPTPLSDDCFGIQVQSEIQANLIKDSLLDMSNYFRQELKNYNFILQLVIDNKIIGDSRHQNGRDKFNLLVKKNPNLENFRRLFDLDIEY